MNSPQGTRPNKSKKQQQKQKRLIIKKPNGKSLAFHSRLIEAPGLAQGMFDN
jgi:hypothetical protein